MSLLEIFIENELRNAKKIGFGAVTGQIHTINLCCYYTKLCSSRRYTLPMTEHSISRIHHDRKNQIEHEYKLSNEIWVFLSHSYEDYEKVRKERDMLEDQHMRTLMFFLKCINYHDEIDSLIKRNIDCHTHFILCDSENARKSDLVNEEVKYIMFSENQYAIISYNHRRIYSFS